MTILLVIIYLSFISLGLPDSLLGAVWPVMHTDFAVPIPFGGYLNMLVAFCTVISSLFAMKIHKWLGTAKTIAISTTLTALAILGFSITPSFWFMFPLAIVLGLGAGAIDSALNNYVALHYKASHMSFLHCCWGIGATIGPLILSYNIKNATWRRGYLIIAIAQASLAAIQFVSMPLWKNRDGQKNAEGVNFTQTVSAKTKPLALLSFFCYCAFETSCILWIATFFVQVLGVSPEISARASSAFFVGITSGRLISGFVSDKVGVKKMIYISSLLAIFAVVILLLSKSLTVSFVATFLTGLGCGPLYPSMIHRTPRRYGSELSPKIIGQQMAAAYVGSTLMPPILGNIAMTTGFTIIPIFGIALISLVFIFTHIIEKSKPGNNLSTNV